VERRQRELASKQQALLREERLLACIAGEPSCSTFLIPAIATKVS
jgi:hypothetical protein